ncbi:unnamed protein product [Notodromas monacha]|uniref:Chitin-binding type-2 domain-containing protein n=1 Tax=Notodromas monacha TaxID=399045 RepID=A0A7R9BHQ8_9CRUS|nr:unnamed protein product [Notodromas monacha]CAG0915709.1 unnamed protein product [Notodromas monacha]
MKGWVRNYGFQESDAQQSSARKRRRLPGGKLEAPDFDCPEDFGYYAHHSDCSKYYVCVFGGALLESCTGGLLYSDELQTCDWPRNVKCDRGVIETDTDSQKSSPLSSFSSTPASEISQTSSSSSSSSRNRDFLGTTERQPASEDFLTTSDALDAGEHQHQIDFNSVGGIDKQALDKFSLLDTSDFGNGEEFSVAAEGEATPTKTRFYRKSDPNPPAAVVEDNRRPSFARSSQQFVSRDRNYIWLRHTGNELDSSVEDYVDVGRSVRVKRQVPAWGNLFGRRSSSRYLRQQPNRHRQQQRHQQRRTRPRTSGHRSRRRLFGGAGEQQQQQQQRRRRVFSFGGGIVKHRNNNNNNVLEQSTRRRDSAAAADDDDVVDRFDADDDDDVWAREFGDFRLPSGIFRTEDKLPNWAPHRRFFGPQQPSSSGVDIRNQGSAGQRFPTLFAPTPQQPAQQSSRIFGNQGGNSVTTPSSKRLPPVDRQPATFPSKEDNRQQFITPSPPAQQFPTRLRAERVKERVTLAKTTPTTTTTTTTTTTPRPTAQPSVNFGNDSDGEPIYVYDYYDYEVPASAGNSDQQNQDQQQEQQNAPVQAPQAQQPAHRGNGLQQPEVVRGDAGSASLFVRDRTVNRNAKWTSDSQQRGVESNAVENNVVSTTAEPIVKTSQAPIRPSRRPTLKPVSKLVPKKVQQTPLNIWKSVPGRPAAVYPQPAYNEPATKCRPDVCLLPDCYCGGGKTVPGGYEPQDIPQVVLLTFDDAVNDLNKELFQDLFERGRVNPNGCPIQATFYVSHEWTDYSQVQNLYADGHEIASHTISHSFGENFSEKRWAQEVEGQRDVMAAYAGVLREDVRGMRAPFLQIGGDKMFKMLHDQNFTYDSSMPVYENKPPSFPYTLDYKLFHDCMIPPCPKKSFPGVWEVPMVMWQDLKGGRCSMVDGCSAPGDAEGIYKMLIKNFERHYTTNRAPVGLFFHAAWFTHEHHKEGFIAFLDTISAMDDVWLVTNWQSIQWMREPTPLSHIKNFKPFGCHYPERPARCARAQVCNVWHNTGVRYMKTCQACPAKYPWTGNTGVTPRDEF